MKPFFILTCLGVSLMVGGNPSNAKSSKAINSVSEKSLQRFAKAYQKALAKKSLPLNCEKIDIRSSPLDSEYISPKHCLKIHYNCSSELDALCGDLDVALSDRATGKTMFFKGSVLFNHYSYSYKGVELLRKDDEQRSYAFNLNSDAQFYIYEENDITFKEQFFDLLKP